MYGISDDHKRTRNMPLVNYKISAAGSPWKSLIPSFVIREEFHSIMSTRVNCLLFLRQTCVPFVNFQSSGLNHMGQTSQGSRPGRDM